MEIGPIGPTGPTGATGPTGPTGPTGATGSIVAVTPESPFVGATGYVARFGNIVAWTWEAGTSSEVGSTGSQSAGVMIPAGYRPWVSTRCIIYNTMGGELVVEVVVDSSGEVVLNYSTATTNPPFPRGSFSWVTTPVP